jgi:hypothetical protein
MMHIRKCLPELKQRIRALLVSCVNLRLRWLAVLNGLVERDLRICESLCCVMHACACVVCT